MRPWFVAGVGGTIEWHAPLRPDAGPTVQVIDGAGTVVIAAGTVASRDTNPDTTLSVGVARGARAIQVASSTGIASGGRLLISGQGVPSEPVVIRGMSGTTVTLTTPLVYDHPASSDVESSRIFYALTGASCPDPGDNWLATFSWASGAATQAPHAVSFGVSRYAMRNPVTPLLLQRLIADLRLQVPLELDWDDLCQRAFDEACDRVSGRGVPIYDYRGAAQKLERPASYVAALLLAEQYGQGYRELREELRERVQETVDIFCAVAAADTDRDLVIDAGEEQGRVGRRAVGRRS